MAILLNCRESDGPHKIISSRTIFVTVSLQLIILKLLLSLPSTASSSARRHHLLLPCNNNYAHQRRTKQLQRLLLLEWRGGGGDGADYDPKRVSPPYYDNYSQRREAQYYHGDEEEREPPRQKRQRYDSDDAAGNPSFSYKTMQRRSDNNNNGSPGVSSLLLNGFATNNQRKLGILFASSGSVITLLGISLFFNKTLLRMGNLLFIAGVPMILGPRRTVGYFMQPKKARATACLLLGIFLVLVAGRPMLGMVLEIFGLLNLFGNLFPLIMVMLRQVPILGDLLPSNGGGGKKRRPPSGASSSREQRRDNYYSVDQSNRDPRDEDVEKYY